MLGSAFYFSKSYDEANQIFAESVANLRKVPGAGELGWVLSMMAISEHTLGKYNQAQEYLHEAFLTGSGILAIITAWSAIAAFVNMLFESGEIERAVEFYIFITRYPLISRSKALMDLLMSNISLAESMLPGEKLVEAQARGRARNLKDTIAEIIAELEEALDD